MTKKLLFLLIALAAFVVPDVGATQKSITLTKDDFTKLDGSPWTVSSYGASGQVIAIKDGITFHCHLRKEGSGEISFIPDESFISVEENPNMLAFTKVALSFNDIPQLSSKLYLYNITGEPDYGKEFNHFQILLNKGYLTISDFHTDFASVNNGGTVVDFNSSPCDKFFIARNETAANYIGENSYPLDKITFYYEEGGMSLAPEIVFSTPHSAKHL